MDEDPTTTAILDAARAAVGHFGVRKTTLSDVARRAGVSRMTVYRRYPDVDALLRDLMTREFGGVMAVAMATDAVAGESVRDRLVRSVVQTAGALRDHPLLLRIAEAEPELLVPYALGRLGHTHRDALVLLEAELARGQHEGSVRAGAPAALGQLVLLVAQAFVFSSGLAEDLDTAALDDSLAELVDAALRPPG